MTYNKVFMNLAVTNTSTVYSLIEVYQRQWKRLESISVFLTEMVTFPCKNETVEYKKFQQGADLSFKSKKVKSSGIHMRWRTPMLDNINGNCMLIVGKKTEL